METNKILIVVATFILACLLILLQLQNNQIDELKDIIAKQDTIRTERIDTVYHTIVITDSVPKLVKQTVIRYDTIKGDTVLTREQALYQDTIKTNDDTISYQAYVSGIKPKLDSINFHTSHRIINTNTTTIIEKQTPQKQKKWQIQPQATFGYDPINKNWGVVVGFGVGYNF